MKKTILPILVVMLASCGGAEDAAVTKQVDTTAVACDSIVLFSGSIDGIEDFYVSNENGAQFTPQTKEIHIVPFVEDDSAKIDPYMFCIVADDFFIDAECMQGYAGKVKIFYDGNRQHLAAEFNLVNNAAEGDVKAYSTEGELLIDRTYHEQYCTASRKDLYAIDWTFDPANAALRIKNVETYQHYEDSVRIIEIGESIHPNIEGTANNLYALLEKPVFENVFTVNDTAFTGNLVGYFRQISMEPVLYFDLAFVDGKLHGIISIHDDWGQLALRERFENGVFVETLFEVDESEMEGMAKPVIYLYPQQEMAVNVQLQLKGELTHSYPTYPDGGWTVKAEQDGTLYDVQGKEYYALFWEGVSARELTYSEGVVIKGSETEKFLEESLETIGLNRREANEFIMYWLPQMENNAYNLIHFSTAEYEEIAQLKITPRPESVLRVMMVWSPLEQPVEIAPQDLSKLRVERKGFTVVEWGGKKQPYKKEVN